MRTIVVIVIVMFLITLGLHKSALDQNVKYCKSINAEFIATDGLRGFCAKDGKIIPME